MTLEKGSDDDLLEGLDHRRLEKSTSMQNASGLRHSGQIHQMCGKTSSQIPSWLRNERHSNPSRHSDHRKARDDVQFVHSGTMAEIKVMRKDMSGSWSKSAKKTANSDFRERQPDRQEHVRRRKVNLRFCVFRE